MEIKVDNDSSKVFLNQNMKPVLIELANIQIVIDVIATRLIECRKLRLDEITTNEISLLEGKLIKHISQQLDVKQRINSIENKSDLCHYPSMENFLTLAGVGKSFTEAWKHLSYSVEDMLNLSDIKLESLLERIKDSGTNRRKFLTAVSLLKKYNGYNACDNSGISSRNGSESSGSVTLDSGVSSGGIQIDLLCATDTEADSKRHFKEIPSTSSSSITPPSPTLGSHSSLDTESDSAFSVSYNQGSPPPRIAMNVTPSTSSVFTSSSAVSPLTPVKASPILKHSTFSPNRESPRSRFPSAGSKATYTTTLVPKLKTSKSTEWNLGNKVSLTSSMSGSNQSLTSITSHPSPSLPKHSKGKKKKNRRPHNLTVDTQLNYISLSRTAFHGSSSTTVSPDAGENSSPKSPRTPATPLTPGSSEISARDRELLGHQPPHTPKTPKSNFKAVKKFFRTKIRKLKRIKSTEQLHDPPDEYPPMHRKRSGTLPSRKSNLLGVDSKSFLASNPNSAYVTPLGSPDLSGIFNNGSNASSRRPSLIDTDKTIVAESPDDAASSQRDALADEVRNDGIDDDEPLTKVNLFDHENVMHSEEWDILYENLKIKEAIGPGRIGTVHKGYWHGDVAIRVIDINLNDEEKLQAFKQEIGVFKKTRHENLELFMGSCMHPPHLAIVTGLCRGHSLFNYIRDAKSQSTNINLIAQQIAQGMGYLHSKGIVHKDLKSKNIFVDGKRVVITGFGLIGLHAVACENRATTGSLMIPNGWLCYIAPELITFLSPPQFQNDDILSTLPYTTMTDVYAFGTVWYELLTGSWPFLSLPAESIIFQVGSGKKQNLNHLHGAAKELLTHCWSFVPSQRPDFSYHSIMAFLDKVQTQIQRSRSTHLRRPGPTRSPSHDRLFDRGQLRHSPFSALHELVE